MADHFYTVEPPSWRWSVLEMIPVVAGKMQRAISSLGTLRGPCPTTRLPKRLFEEDVLKDAGGDLAPRVLEGRRGGLYPLQQATVVRR